MRDYTNKVIYIAGPYRGEIDKNVALAERRAAHLARLGVTFVCPHSNGRPHDDLNLSEDYWIRMTMELMRRCDAVLVVGDWQGSSGTRGEIKEAYKMAKPVFFDVALLADWLE